MRKFSLSFLFAIMLLGIFASAAFAAGDQYPGNNGPTDHNGTLTPGSPTPKANANMTGDKVSDPGVNHDSVVKALQGQQVHKAYQNNTNSCASCHQTHTASGKSLLFADSVYNTCTACHDGTLGFANVFSTPQDTKLDGAGTFGGSHATNMSVHMANDTVKINAAPGGNPTGTSVAGSSQWGSEFNCASCHAPHGSYSDRLLSYNPNGMGSALVKDGGNAVADVPVVDDITKATGTDALLKETLGDGSIKLSYKKKVGTSWYSAPVLYGYGVRTDGSTYNTRLQKDDGTTVVYKSDTEVKIDYPNGTFTSLTPAGKTNLDLATKGYVSRPFVVKMVEKNYHIVQDAYWSGTTVADVGEDENYLKALGYSVSGTGGTAKVTGLGKAMSTFCSACHTDYFTSSGAGKTTHWGSKDETDPNAAYRHTTNSDTYTCVRCHYAHGTDAGLMMDASGQRVSDIAKTTDVNDPAYQAALVNMTDANKSSALKKFTNMSVCWACHNSSHAESIKNTDTAPADHPTGMPKSVDGIQR